MIIEVNEDNLSQAGRIHSEAWKASHRSFCSAGFVEKHTPAAQTAYLRREMTAGKRVYMLSDDVPVGIVSVWESLIENLYILPERQNRGYGTQLLKYAMACCDGVPTLWILDNNEGARRLYARHGFRPTGKKQWLSDTLSELEMVLEG